MKNSNLRYAIYAVIVAGLLVIPFVEKSYNIDMNDLRKSLKTHVTNEFVVLGDKSDLRKFYHIQFSDLEDFILYVPATTMRVNEVAIFKVKKDMADTVLKMVKSRCDFQKNVFKGYGTKQCQQLDNAVLEQWGQYIVYIVGEDKNQLLDIVKREAK